jgi:ectoine hydroxylase-related dioxygenase (phytanoyl-CoA dioxygenase family)
MIDQSQVEEFCNNGFIIIRNLVSKEDRISLLESFERIMMKVNLKPMRYRTRYNLKQGVETNTWGVNDIFCPELFEERISDFIADRQILTIISKLLDSDNLRFWAGHALWSPLKVKYDLPWYRDEGDPNQYDETGRSTHVQFNVALKQVYSFRVIPGSHRRPSRKKNLNR